VSKRGSLRQNRDGPVSGSFHQLGSCRLLLRDSAKIIPILKKNGPTDRPNQSLDRVLISQFCTGYVIHFVVVVLIFR